MRTNPAGHDQALSAGSLVEGTRPGRRQSRPRTLQEQRPDNVSTGPDRVAKLDHRKYQGAREESRCPRRYSCCKECRPRPRQSECKAQWMEIEENESDWGLS